MASNGLVTSAEVLKQMFGEVGLNINILDLFKKDKTSDTTKSDAENKVNANSCAKPSEVENKIPTPCGEV